MAPGRWLDDMVTAQPGARRIGWSGGAVLILIAIRQLEDPPGERARQVFLGIEGSARIADGRKFQLRRSTQRMTKPPSTWRIWPVM